MGEDEHGTLAWLGTGRPAALCQRPYGHWCTMNFVAALRCDRIDAPCVLDQPINGQSFIHHVEQCLVPTLSPGDVVIMDNLSSHKKPAIRSAIRAVGAKLLFLPPYSPDLNPIEQGLCQAQTSDAKGRRESPRSDLAPCRYAS